MKLKQKKASCTKTLFSLQFLKKVQRQERIVEEVKLVLKPAYNDRRITKEHYKEILRKTVPKVCTVTLIIFRYALRSVLYFYSFLGSGWVPYKFNCPSQIVKKITSAGVFQSFCLGS